MRLSHLTFPAIALLAVTAQAQTIEVEFVSRAARTGAAPAPVASQLPPAPVNGSDTCATADALGSSLGSVPYDNTNATIEPTIGQTAFTGGYCNYGCAEYGTGQVAVLTDVWFSWTSPATGRMRITTCPNQNDTKVSVYNSFTCPTGTACLGCSDDYHYGGAPAAATIGLLDSIIYTDVVIGQQVLIQVGQSSFNIGALGFAGSFDIEVDPPHETGLNNLDDNDAEGAFAVGAAGDGCVAIQRLANVGDVTTVTGVQVCWGYTPGVGSPVTWVAGAPAYVAIWDDSVTNDGNPIDAVLLETVATTIQSPGSNTYVSIPFTTPHTINGIYFIGYGSIRTAHVAPMANYPLTGDTTVCNIQPDTAWWSNNVAAASNLVNLAGNSTPPRRLQDHSAGGFACPAQSAANVGNFHSAWTIRADVLAGPAPLGTGVCFGDSNALCPCTASGGSGVPNPGIAGHGCANSVFPDGALLTATGSPIDNPVGSGLNDTVVLRCENMTGPGLFIQSNGLVAPIVNFNDGNLCAAVGILRMGVSFPTAGVGLYPSPPTAPNKVSVAGAPVLSNGIPTPPTKYYQCWYRDAPVFCNPRGDNMSNGLTFVWLP